jgi:hypothetical protein
MYGLHLVSTLFYRTENLEYLRRFSKGLGNGILRSRDSVPGTGKRFFLFHSVQGGFEAHLGSYPMITADSFSGNERGGG